MNQMKDVNEIIYKIIGSCMEVHKTLGPGFPVDTYKKALAIEFSERELAFNQDIHVEVSYKENLIGTLDVDFVVGDAVIVALRSQEDLKDIEIQQVLRFLPLTQTTMGLLVNFGNIKIQYKRILPSRQGRGELRKDQSIGVAAYREMGKTREANPIL
ncbi:GxxExxY protein [bacterium]|nr:GxxExxY protein [bacterium]